MNNKYTFNLYRKFFDRRDCPIYDEHWANGYFLFDMGKDSVVHFKVKKFKGWLFGIWFNQERNGKQVDLLFWQYRKDIDKFKPSATEFVIQIPVEERKHILLGDEYNLFANNDIIEKLTRLLQLTQYTKLARLQNKGAIHGITKKQINKDFRTGCKTGLWKNIMGDVGIVDGILIRFPETKLFFSKGLFLWLRYGKRVVWN